MITVIGSGGQLGTALHRILGDRDATFVDYPAVDITDPQSVTDVVEGAATVINAAAYTDVDGAETDEARALAVNGAGPENLARACAQTGATLLHVSTDYVFDGTATSPIPEDAPVAPRSAYGRTKAAGERAILAAGGRGYVIRTAWLYGGPGKNFVDTMIALEASRDHVDVVTDQVGAPTWAAHLAQAILALADSAAAPGIYHWTNSGQASWREFAQAIFAGIGADPDRVRPTTSESFVRPAPRPAYSVLSHERWLSAGLPAPAHWRDALTEYLASR